MDMQRSEVVDQPVVTRRGTTVQTVVPTWSPAQIVGIIVGIGYMVLGFTVLARTGFNTAHIYTPQDTVWGLPHSPLFGLIEIGFGALLLLASVVPGASRTFMAILGAISLAFGIVVLSISPPNRLNHWLGVTHRSGWACAIAGAVVLLAALFSPVFSMSRQTTATAAPVAE
jgi:hypothetical protein